MSLKQNTCEEEELLEEELPEEDGDFDVIYTEEEEEEEGEFVQDESSNEIEFSSPPEFSHSDFAFQQCVQMATAYIPFFNIHARENNSTVIFSIPSSILPLSYSVINGFNVSEVLSNVEISLNNGNWKEKPTSISVVNPIFHTSFIGRPLIINKISNFFNPFYEPKEYYKSISYVFVPPGNPNKASFDKLLSEGYNEERVKTALNLCHNKLEEAREYLITGQLEPSEPKKVEVSYRECPLAYLILEITESILDLHETCCVCGNKIGCKGLKASVCDESICNFSFESLGVGANIIAEIRRDHLVIDFLLSVASTAKEKFIKLSLLPSQLRILPMFFASLPAVQTMASLDSDAALIEMITPGFFEILRLIILSNKAHLMTLPKHLEIKGCGDQTIQFFSIVETPEKERKLLSLKKQHGVMYLWHGSSIDRWHSIMHSGLQDLGNTPDQQNGGHWFGAGVYQTQLASYALSTYAPEGLNFYKGSILGKSFKIMALIENAKVPQLNLVTTNEYTQQNNDALSVRCLMVVKSHFEYDTSNMTPKSVPTLNDMLHYLAQKKNRNS